MGGAEESISTDLCEEKDQVIYLYREFLELHFFFFLKLCEGYMVVNTGRYVLDKRRLTSDHVYVYSF